MGNFLKPSLLRNGFDVDNLKDAAINFKEHNDDKRAWRDIWSAGQCVGRIHKRESIAEIVDGLKEEFNSI
ncbi:MAG: nitronate monooxygenase, partial [Tenacibaculum sp.]